MIPLFCSTSPILNFGLLTLGKSSQPLPVPLARVDTQVAGGTYLLASSSNLIDSTCSLLSFFARAIYDAPSVRRAMLDLDLFFDIVSMNE